MDFHGIGESDGEPRRDIAGLYENELWDDIKAAMAALRYRLRVRRFVVIGLCSGGYWAFHAAVRNPEVRGAILMNPSCFFWDPELDHRRMMRRLNNTLGGSDQHPQISRKAMARSLAAIESNQSRLTLVLAEGEPLLLEMEEDGQLPYWNRSRIHCIRLANCGHTFRPLWAQKLVHELIDRELDAVLLESPAALKRDSMDIPAEQSFGSFVLP